MKTTLNRINRIYPNGFTWHVWRHYRTGRLLSQYRPNGGAELSPGRDWELVRSMPSNPKITNPQQLDRILFENL
jgi:hypothetical protein